VLLIGFFLFKKISNTLVAYVEEIGVFVLGEISKKRKRKMAIQLFGYSS
jgi:hypothetical protein